METLAGYAKCRYKIKEDKVFVLDKGIYGLVQAAYSTGRNSLNPWRSPDLC